MELPTNAALNNIPSLAILSILGLFVVIIYAQTKTVSTLAIANDSQLKIEDNISNNNINNQQDDDKKLVKRTGSVRAVSAMPSVARFVW